MLFYNVFLSQYTSCYFLGILSALSPLARTIVRSSRDQKLRRNPVNVEVDTVVAIQMPDRWRAELLSALAA
jgi:hypothetical protein